jgi:hypothetical protein
MCWCMDYSCQDRVVSKRFELHEPNSQVVYAATTVLRQLCTHLTWIAMVILGLRLVVTPHVPPPLPHHSHHYLQMQEW